LQNALIPSLIRIRALVGPFQIRKDHLPAVFLENVTDSRLLDQIASETGAKVGGTLYSDALSDPSGPAGTYLEMFRHNIGTLTAALSS
jgi:zinc/manganese transport system substrate-binding protein